MTAADVIVIGGGIVGCALAYHLRAHGRSVVVVERHGVGHEGSGRNAGGVRQQARVPAELPLAMAAVERWPALERELGAPTEYVQEGNLLIAQSEASVRRLEQRLAWQAPFGLDSTLIDGDQLRRLRPLVGPRARAALHCPSDGHANPLLATLAFAGAARRRGAAFAVGHEVRGLRQTTAGWMVETDRARFEGEVVVNVAGPGAVALCALVDVALPVVPARTQTLVTERVGPLFGQFVQDWDAKVFARQTWSGTVIFGDLTEDYLVAGHQARPADAVRAARAAIDAFPAFARLTVIRGWGGVLDISLDRMPLIGPLDGLPGFFVCAGSSGHGFALAPAIGELLADWIARGRRSPLLAPFDPARFSATGTIDNNAEEGAA